MYDFTNSSCFKLFYIEILPYYIYKYIYIYVLYVYVFICCDGEPYVNTI